MSEIELVTDGDGLAVVGEPTAVERYLRDKGLWVDSRELDLGRLSAIASRGSDIMQTASGIAAASGRWVKLTQESARKVAAQGLMQAKEKDGHHLMVGKPGTTTFSWLQADTGPGTMWTNPAVLSGLAGLMSQASSQQSMAEITNYLASIDEKVDDVLRKVDDTMVAQMLGMSEALERAMTLRDAGGSIDKTTWSTVDQAPATIGATQSYALDQIKAVTERLENTRLRDVAKAAQQADPDVRRWLAVLARCFQLQEAVDVLEIELRMADSPSSVDGYRKGMLEYRERSRARIAEHTEALLARMEEAVTRANEGRLWHRTPSTIIVESSNGVAGDMHRFHELLEINVDPRSWAIQPLGRVADVGSRSIQQVKDKGPAAAGLAASGLAFVAFVSKQARDNSN